MRYPTLVRQDRQYKNQYKKQVEWKDLPIYVCRVGRSSLLIYCSSIIGVGRRGRLSYYYILFNPCDSKQCYSSLSIRAISNPRSAGQSRIYTGSSKNGRTWGIAELVRRDTLSFSRHYQFAHLFRPYFELRVRSWKNRSGSRGGVGGVATPPKISTMCDFFLNSLDAISFAHSFPTPMD